MNKKNVDTNILGKIKFLKISNKHIINDRDLDSEDSLVFVPNSSDDSDEDDNISNATDTTGDEIRDTNEEIYDEDGGTEFTGDDRDLEHDGNEENDIEIDDDDDDDDYLNDDSDQVEFDEDDDDDDNEDLFDD